MNFFLFIILTSISVVVVSLCCLDKILIGHFILVHTVYPGRDRSDTGTYRHLRCIWRRQPQTVAPKKTDAAKAISVQAQYCSTKALSCCHWCREASGLSLLHARLVSVPSIVSFVSLLHPDGPQNCKSNILSWEK